MAKFKIRKFPCGGKYKYRGGHRRYDYGDMFTKSQGGIDTSPLTQMNIDTPAGLQQGASPYYTPSNLNTIAKPPEPRMSADQKGSLIGAAGQLVGSAIESKQKMQDTEFTQDLQKSRKEAKAALYGIGTAAAAVNPIVGGAIIAGTAIGSAIGSQTQGEWGQYKSRSGNAIDEMVNPVTGYQGIKRALQGKQTASGAVNKLTLGLFGKSDNQKEAEKGKRAFEAARVRKIKERSQQTLANYNTEGKTDYNTMLAKGGFLPKYTKRGKRRLDYGGLVGKPEPKTTTDPLEEEEGDPNQAASPYYSQENLNALTSSLSAIKPQPQANPPPGQQPNKVGAWLNSPKGQAAGGVANVAANMLPQYNNPNQTAGEKATDQAGVQIAGAIGPWWGALAKVGTTASGHIRKDDTGSHARGFIGDTVNPFHQFNSLQEGKGKEQTAAFLNPVMASHLAADRRKQAALSKKRLEMVERQKAGQQKLAQYNVNGNIYAKYGTQFPMGGDLPTPTDQGQGEQLASNMAQYHGPNHDNGGIELDTDQNAQPDIEVEGQEVIKDNMVFSNRLRPSKDVKNIVRDSGVGTKKGDTYATLSARIGKKKGKFEEQMNSTRPGEKNSAQLMQARLDETANLLFMDQQVRKFKKGANGKYSKGGKFPNGGKVPPKKPIITQDQDPFAYINVDPTLTTDPETIANVNKNLNKSTINRNLLQTNPAGQSAYYYPDYSKVYGRPTTDSGYVQQTWVTAPEGTKALADSTQQASRQWLLENDPRFRAKTLAAKRATGKKPYGGYTTPGSEILPPRRRGRMVQATNVTPPPVFPPAVNAPVIPTPPTAKYPYSTPNLQSTAPVTQPFSWDNEFNRLEEVRRTPTYPKGGLIGPVKETPVDPRTLYTKYDPSVSPQSQIPAVRRNRIQALRTQRAILDKNVDPNTMHPDTGFVADSTAAASQKFLTRFQPGYTESMQPYQRGPLKPVDVLPIQRYGGYTKRLHKVNDALKTRAFGGYLPVFAVGGEDDEEEPYKSRKSIWGTTAPPVYPDLSTRTSAYAVTPTKANLNPSTAPLKVLPSVKTPAGLTGGMQGLLDARQQRITDKALKKKISTRGFDVSDYKGDIAAGLGTIANQIQINKLETQFDPELAATPRNPYTDRRDYLTHQAGEQYRTATQGIEGSDAQSNLALKANMYAKSLGSLNQSLDQEQQREDMFGLRHADTKNRTDLINAQTKNQAKMLSMENRNQKRALTQQNIDNLIKSYQGNEAVRSFTKTEQGKNLLAALQSGDRGTSERLLESLSPEMRKQIGLKYEAEGGIFKKGGIYIKPKNRGKFNALKKRTGKTTAQLKHSKNPLTRKRATFAANAKKWKH